MIYVLAGLLFLTVYSWTCFFLLKKKYQRVEHDLAKIAKNLDLELNSDKSYSLVDLINKILDLSNKRLNLITPDLVENRIRSREELSHSLERVINKAHSLLDAESIEIALYDTENKLFHTALLVGKPFAHELQSMLTASEKPTEELEAQGIVIQSISFSSSILGSIRIALSDPSKLNKSNKEIIRFIALQAALAIMNAQYAEELLKLQRNSEAGVKARTGFLANLSHEIRGPLGIILNAVELVMAGLCGDLNADQSDTLAMVKNNGEHLLELVNDVLDYAKVESGNLKPKLMTINAVEITKDLADVIRTQAQKKQQVVIFDVPEQQINVTADKRHLRQMLLNILSNAVKYTRDGGEIKIWITRNDNLLTFNVQDNGIGIHKDQLAKVFSVFERVEDSYALDQLGTGLGMPLTKKLAELNKGCIDFDSVYGKGSTFRLSLQIAEGLNETTCASEHLNLKDLANLESIFYIEKNRDESSVVRRYLEHVGFKVLLHDQNVITDEYEITQETKIVLIDASVLKQHEENFIGKLKDRYPKLAILILTSKALDFETENYLKNGADICISKPINLAELAQSCLSLSKR